MKKLFILSILSTIFLITCSKNPKIPKLVVFIVVDQSTPSITGFMGNMAISRLFAVSKKDAEDLKRHAKEEMSFLAKLLPPLYHSENIN